MEPLIPKPLPVGRPRGVKMRRLVNAIRYINSPGGAWHMLPRDSGPRSSVHHDLRTFRDHGTWPPVHNTLRAKDRRKAGLQAKPSAGSLDRQSFETYTPHNGSHGCDAGKNNLGRIDLRAAVQHLRNIIAKSRM
ncbi:MAG: transposase [Planctomycetota bacterium]